MNRRNSFISRLSSLVSGLLLAASASAQTPAAKFVDSARVEIERAVAANDPKRIDNVVVLLDRALVAFPNDPYLLHYRGYARYRQSINRFMAQDIPGVAPLAEKGIADLQQSSDKLPWPETYALLAALTSFKLAVDPSLAMTIGPALTALGAKAMQLGANNPRVLYLQAVGASRTPPEYGGGTEKARDLVARALKAFATDKPGALMPAWGRDEAIAFEKGLPKPGGH